MGIPTWTCQNRGCGLPEARGDHAGAVTYTMVRAQLGVCYRHTPAFRVLATERCLPAACCVLVGSCSVLLCAADGSQVQLASSALRLMIWRAALTSTERPGPPTSICLPCVPASMEVSRRTATIAAIASGASATPAPTADRFCFQWQHYHQPCVS